MLSSTLATWALTLITVHASNPEADFGRNQRCADVMANNGLNFSSFWHGAAHGIHSLYLEEVRHFFEPEAKENNKIPVLNPTLSAEHVIFFDSPLAGYDEDFYTMSLKVVAFYMANDAPDFAQQGTNIWEKITHQFHMHEIYAAAGPIYRQMKADPPNDPELCPCVNDITANGILTELVNIASILKYFGWNPDPNTSSYQHYVSGYVGSYDQSAGPPTTHNVKRYNITEEITPKLVAEFKDDYMKDSSKWNAGRVLTVDPWQVRTLEGPDQWISYEAMLTESMLGSEELNDFATFVFCKLNQPELDHPANLFN